MLTNRTVFDELVTIAREKECEGYLAHYRDDLFKHDRAQLESPCSDRYIWILRQCGTVLYPVASGHDALWATYWLKQGNTREAPSLAYLIAPGTGKVEPITYERAEQLASEPHPEGKIVKVQLFGAQA